MAQPTTITLSGRRGDLVTLGVAVVVGADGKLPSEVRIFKAGANATEKGDYLFDDVAARSVIEHFNAHGVRLMIDLEHLSLDEECPNYDPDPRAWCKLATKPAEHPTADAHSDLWLVDLKWLDDGIADLREIPLKAKLSRLQTIQVNALRNEEPYFDREVICEFLKKLLLTFISQA